MSTIGNRKFCSPKQLANSIALVATLALILLISYTVVSIKHNGNLVDAVHERFGENVRVSRSMGLIMLDMIFYLLGLFFLGLWYTTLKLRYIILAMLPLTISWSILLATVIQSLESNDVDDDFTMRSLQCDEVEIRLDGRRAELPFDRTDNVTAVSVVIRDLPIDETLCETGIALATIALAAVTAIIASLGTMIKNYIEEMKKPQGLSLSPASCNISFHCACKCGEEQEPKQQNVKKEKTEFYDTFNKMSDLVLA